MTKKVEPQVFEITVEVEVHAIPELFKHVSDISKGRKLISITNIEEGSDMDIDI